MRQMYTRGLPLLNERYFIMEKLCQQFCPKLAAHFLKNDIIPIMFCTKWFMTVYAYDFPFEAVVRIWDVFLNEGNKIIWRVALQCLKDNEATMLKLQYEELTKTVQSINKRIVIEPFLERAFKLKLKEAHIVDHRKGFHKKSTNIKF